MKHRNTLGMPYGRRPKGRNLHEGRFKDNAEQSFGNTYCRVYCIASYHRSSLLGER
jgi:hypothetical protein